MKPITTTTPDRAPIERFRRVLLFNIGVLAVVWIGVALSGLWLGFSWFLIALLIFFAISAGYLVYLVKRFTTPPP